VANRSPFIIIMVAFFISFCKFLQSCVAVFTGVLILFVLMTLVWYSRLKLSPLTSTADIASNLPPKSYSFSPLTFYTVTRYNISKIAKSHLKMFYLTSKLITAGFSLSFLLQIFTTIAFRYISKSVVFIKSSYLGFLPIIIN